MKALLLPMLALGLLLAGCYGSEAPKQEAAGSPGSGAVMAAPGYKGQLIAGNVTPYIRYSKEDFDKARMEGKVIYLYFYATWCPICAAERPNVLAAFDELSDPRAVGFEVHYKDDQSNAEDAEAARLFGIPYQHTVVILAPDGTEAYRSLEPISKDTIKSEIAKAEG